MNKKMKNQAFEIVECRIPLITDAASARQAIEALLEPVDEGRAEQLMDQYNIRMSRGEYGSGETYYPKGTNIDYEGIDYAVRCNGYSVDESNNLTSGIWISSSEMC